MQNINDVEYLHEMIQLKEKLKAAENHQKYFQVSKKKLETLNPNVITCDEQDIVRALHVACEREIIHTQYCIERKRLDAYLYKYKLGKEVGEYDDEDRNPNYEQSRQSMIDGHGITVIRANPEAPNCINRLINQIHMHIVKSIKNKLKNQLKNH